MENNPDAGSRPSVSVGRRLSYFKWDKYTPDPSFWSPPTTAKKKKPFATQSARPFVSKLSFTETPLAEDQGHAASASSRAAPHAHAASGLPPPQASSFRRRPTETTGIPLPPTSKRPRPGPVQSASLRTAATASAVPAPAFSASQRVSTTAAISSAAAAAAATTSAPQGATTTAGLLQLVSNQSDRIEKLSRELEKEREARLALERRFLELRSKLTLAHVI